MLQNLPKCGKICISRIIGDLLNSEIFLYELKFVNERKSARREVKEYRYTASPMHDSR